MKPSDLKSALTLRGARPGFPKSQGVTVLAGTATAWAPRVLPTRARPTPRGGGRRPRRPRPLQWVSQDEISGQWAPVRTRTRLHPRVVRFERAVALVALPLVALKKRLPQQNDYVVLSMARDLAESCEKMRHVRALEARVAQLPESNHAY